MVLVAHVNNRVSLVGADLHLVVDFGYKRSECVDAYSTKISRAFNKLWRGTMSGEHYWSSRRNLRDVVDKSDPQPLEAVDDYLVMNNFVVTVDRRFEDLNHPDK